MKRRDQILISAGHPPALACALAALIAGGLWVTSCPPHAHAQPKLKVPATPTVRHVGPEAREAAEPPSKPPTDADQATEDGVAEPGTPNENRREDPCPPGDLLHPSRVRAQGHKGSPMRVRDGRLALEGALWNAPQAVVLEDANARLTVDLYAEREIRALLLQGDNNDVYRIEGSTDRKNYETLWTAPVDESGQGLRTRTVELRRPVRARYLRVRGMGGDGYYSIAELRAYCKLPKPWPPALNLPPRKYGWAAIDNPMMVGIKGGLAAVGSAVLLWCMFWAWRKRPSRHKLARDISLGIVGVTALGAWWNFGHFHFDHYIHIWEHYHYYIGAKYPELRYSRIYECTAVADVQDGRRAQVKARRMRALATNNELGTTDEILANPTRCTDHFSKERWEAFRKDIRFFRSRFSQDRWDKSQSDHGYNATPVWAIAARLIAESRPLNWDTIVFNGAIDSALLIAMWMAVWWAFGWRAACVALIYWGCNFPARYYWNGGSFLRYDWQFWMVLGLCLLRRDKMFFGGAALTYATLLRVFPGFLVAAVILKVLARMVRERRFVLAREHQIFAAGCIVTLATLIPASAWATRGIDAWGEFAFNSKKHLATALTNNMGLKTVMGYEHTTRAIQMRNDTLEDPFKQWKDARQYYYAKRMPIYLAVLFMFLILLARAGDREETWVAACLGAGLIPMAAELTCYYYGFLLAYGLIWEKRKFPGFAAAALAGITCWISILPWNDDHFAGMSLATCIVVILVTAHVAFGPRVPPLIARRS